MAIETELKLRIQPEQLTRLKRHALLRKHQITAPVTHRLYNVYYDTPDLELHQSRMAVRLRRVAGKWLQTLKGGGQVLAGLHQRLEWEVPVPSASLDFSNLDAWDEYLPPALRDSLQPVFITDFYRTSRLLDWQGAIIEVCMDRGEVKTSQHSTPICEVELELKSGKPQQLFDLAQAILDIVPFELDVVSKAEQGFRLIAGYIEKPVKSASPGITRSDSLTDNLQTLIWSCLLHFQGNLRGAQEGRDSEYLHQMRVALRRLRIVLRLAEKIHADEELAALREMLARLGVTLGRIREWDVFIARTIAPMSLLIEGAAARQSLQSLLAASEQHRINSYDALRRQAREWQRLLLRLAIWMNGDYWRKAETRGAKTRDFATHRLHQLARRYKKAGFKLNTLDASQLHALRIHAKKLRYSAEFFAAQYDTRKVKSYLAALGEVQELLGEINDITVAHRLLDELASVQPENREVILLLKNHININLSIKNKSLNEISHVFGKIKSFW